MIGPAVDAADLVVLDAHGVVFNRVLPSFVRDRAVERGDAPDAVWQRWLDDVRRPFWEGRSTPTEMWHALFPGDNAARLSAELERRYTAGPLFHFAATTQQRVWLLSNHRSGWLLPRLDRFGIRNRFERVLISDQIGSAKPDADAFRHVRDAMYDTSVVLLDDSPTNVETARDLGIDAHLLPCPEPIHPTT